MPYAFAGHCYATPGEALEAFQESFPVFSAGYFVAHVSSSVNAGGVVSYTMAERQYGSNILNNRTNTFTLASCSVVDAPVFDPVAAGGVFAFFFLGVAGTWYLSQNLGLILEAVKKW